MQVAATEDENIDQTDLIYGPIVIIQPRNNINNHNNHNNHIYIYVHIYWPLYGFTDRTV